MAEKRFTLGKVACYRTCLIKDKGVKLGNSKICDLLNELSDENEQLKEIITGQRDTIKRDNEWENKAIEEIKELKKENEQLKQLLNEAEDIILCQTTPHYQRQWENIKKNIDGDVE